MWESHHGRHEELQGREERQSVCVLSCVQLFATPWTAAHQATLSMEFSRQEHWSGLPLPTSRDFPDPEIEPMSPVSPALAGGFLSTKPPGKHSGQQIRLPFPPSLAFPSLFSVFPSFSFGFLPYPPVSSILASLPLRRVPLDKGRGGIVPQTWKARQEPESPNLVTLHPDLFVVTNSGTDDLSLNSLVISFFIWNIETESWKGSHSHSIYRFTTS